MAATGYARIILIHSSRNRLGMQKCPEDRKKEPVHFSGSADTMLMGHQGPWNQDKKLSSSEQ